MDLKSFIRDIPDWPKPGIVFKDITPLLACGHALDDAILKMAKPFAGRGINLVCAAESRGFIFGAAVARELGAGFVPVRKPNKLPFNTEAISYELEYGTDTLQIHTDAVTSGQTVLMVDDLLATGGTMKACCELVNRLGGRIVGASFLIELGFLGGRNLLNDHCDEMHTVMTFD